MRKVVVFLILASAVVLVALAVALVREFSIRSVVAADAADLPTTAVVFTGQFDRIELALHLFDQGRLDRIFIWGERRCRHHAAEFRGSVPGFVDCARRVELWSDHSCAGCQHNDRECVGNSLLVAQSAGRS